MSSVETLEVVAVEGSAEVSAPLLGANLDVIRGVKVKLEVRIGEAEMTVDELLSLGENSVVQLSRPTTAPVDLLLEGKVVARGHLVAVDDNFGVQITELTR
ncbi:flagellar motor switch protein FliN [Exilibacterium tricleocarpae]|uniref:Flagellar motor switch protein FliN n=1 Tax=Exilibacterium tricleocarpae TaxID=2591008 RepID=A0A545T881_9GAMM|nr:FliM/FliN family flagellar motor switch protein [Exilibacterium tricleocarpae]TQV73419.1 flagellar motor switch protein FliN [Exilibacterium tricleocarpae]